MCMVFVVTFVIAKHDLFAVFEPFFFCTRGQKNVFSKHFLYLKSINIEIFAYSKRKNNFRNGNNLLFLDAFRFN